MPEARLERTRESYKPSSQCAYLLHDCHCDYWIKYGEQIPVGEARYCPIHPRVTFRRGPSGVD
jgi:hypothetical protein